VTAIRKKRQNNQKRKTTNEIKAESFKSQRTKRTELKNSNSEVERGRRKCKKQQH